MKATMRIGELAAQSGRSIHTLRYYEEVGLIPFVLRDAGGRRRYNTQHVEWLFFLARLQSTGMTLADMQQYTALVSQGKHTIAARVALLQQHMAQLDGRMLELARSRKLIAAKLDFYEDWEHSGRYPGSGWLEVYEADAGKRT